MDSNRKKKLQQARNKLDRRVEKSRVSPSASGLASVIEALKNRDFDDCINKCDAIVQSNRSVVAAYMLKGRACLGKGENEEAIRVVKQAIDSGIDDAMLWCELGNFYSESNNQSHAIDAWRSSLKKDPSVQIARKNLGFALFEANQLSEAEDNLVIALNDQPADLAIIRTLAALWNKQQNHQKAIELLERAIVDHSQDSATYKLLSSIYRSTGDTNNYRTTLRRWLDMEPDNSVANHLLAGIESENAPQRASDDYVREVFDQFAATFDADLENLHYEAPAHVARAIEAVYGESDVQNVPARTILDAGCGTGICGPILRPYAQALIGVDLSGQMVRIADERGCYDQLDVAELTAYLKQSNDKYDAIVGCDTFNYFGDLLELFDACCHALKEHGILVITLEHGDESTCTDYKLNPNGRYIHSSRYLEQSVSAANLKLLKSQHVSLRTEADKAVEGLLVTLQK